MVMNNDDLCVISNAFIDRRPQMTRLENQLFYIALSQINPHLPNSIKFDEGFVTITLPWEGVLKKLGKIHDVRHISTYIKELGKACDNLMEGKKSTIGYYNPDSNADKNYKKFHIFSLIEFGKKDGFIFEFDRHMTPYLLELYNKPFAQLLLSELCKLKKPNAIRLLEVCMAFNYANKGKKTIKTSININELRGKMYLNETLSYKEIKRSIIKPSIEEINKSTRYKIVCEEEKEGKNIVNLTFYVTLPDELVFGKKIAINQTIMKEKTVYTAPAEPTPTIEQEHINEYIPNPFDIYEGNEYKKLTHQISASGQMRNVTDISEAPRELSEQNQQDAYYRHCNQDQQEIENEQQKELEKELEKRDEEYKKQFDINFIYNDMGKGELLDNQRKYMQRLDDDVKRGRQAGDKFYDTHVKHLKVINARLEAL